MAHIADSIIQDLKEGNERFLAGTSIHSSEISLKRLKEFSQKGQVPKAIVLCCSDSRAPVEMIFDQGIGDLFVIRVAGNIVAPSLVGSVEFAASTFGTSLVLVMGHSKCGAITATLNHIATCEAISSSNIHAIVSRIKPHIYSLTQVKGLDGDELHKRSVEANVIAAVDQLSNSSSRMIEELLQQEKLKIVGGVLDLDSGAVNFLNF
ncbi:MAG: carbonic anhydrase [Oligoflexia bacterium]|nr:carbonic anhydrase [Oligoflexia bacterium]